MAHFNALNVVACLWSVNSRNVPASPAPTVSADLLAQAAMAVLSLRNTHRVIDGIMALALYPLSLMVVAGLEAIGWD